MEHTFFCRRSFISLLFQFLNQISRRYAIVFFGGLLYFSSPVNHSYLTNCIFPLFYVTRACFTFISII